MSTDRLAGHATNKDDLPTPALLVDLDHFEATLEAMAAQCRRQGCYLRPHAKTHKCPEIARRQVAAGARGISTATVPEAEAMARAGIPGVLLTSPIVEPGKISRMVDLARSGCEVLLAVGHLRQVELLAEAAMAAGTLVDVLVDLDVGDHRFGIEPGEPALGLARAIDRSPSLRLRGVQAYSGLASHVRGYEARRSASLGAMSRAVETLDLLRRSGLDSAYLSGGSTGTYDIDCRLPVEVELQCGSYIFMDVEYRAIGSRDGGAAYDDFRRSLSVLTTVVSVDREGHASVDAGVKAFATETPFRPEARDRPGLEYKYFGDEFGKVTARPGADSPAIGDRLEFYVPHCDPTVHLYDRLYAVRGDIVEAVWDIVARREAPMTRGRRSEVVDRPWR
ncbi:DSD1 family PLP-dependent enzyme [Singulisphaera sp. PoT]|uniref:DSD1 family PLP-dependent enzyme n=1 Tax=Singulisphaera sp. PoT TaxID=3411797 RepID=UPI003BF4BD17